MTRQGFYAWRRRGPSQRQLGDDKLKRLIVRLHDESLQTYGVPRIQLDLAEDHDVHVGRKRVARLMRELGLQGVSRQGTKPRTTVPDAKAPPAPDLVERRFRADEPNRLWLADITYVPTLEGWLFLGVVMDMYSRKVVGWSMRDDLKADLVVDALAMAVARRKPKPGVVHHSDRGTRAIHLACVRPHAEGVRARRVDGLARGCLRQCRLRVGDLDAEGRMDQAAPVHEPRPGEALDLPVHRDVLQLAETSQLTRWDQSRRIRETFPRQTTKSRY